MRVNGKLKTTPQSEDGGQIELQQNMIEINQNLSLKALFANLADIVRRKGVTPIYVPHQGTHITTATISSSSSSVASVDTSKTYFSTENVEKRKAKRISSWSAGLAGGSTNETQIIVNGIWFSYFVYDCSHSSTERAITICVPNNLLAYTKSLVKEAQKQCYANSVLEEKQEKKLYFRELVKSLQKRFDKKDIFGLLDMGVPVSHLENALSIMKILEKEPHAVHGEFEEKYPTRRRMNKRYDFNGIAMSTVYAVADYISGQNIVIETKSGGHNPFSGLSEKM